MALRARIYGHNRHLLFDVAFICSTLTHCGVCDLTVWRLKWEVSYVHQRVWRWKWFSCQSSYVLQRLRLCRASDTVFRCEIDSQRQWGYGTCYSDSFPAAKECTANSIWCLLFSDMAQTEFSGQNYSLTTVPSAWTLALYTWPVLSAQPSMNEMSDQVGSVCLVLRVTK